MASQTTFDDMRALAEVDPAASIESSWTMVRTLATRIGADKGEPFEPGQLVDAAFAGRWFTGLGLPPDGLGASLHDLTGVYEDVADRRATPDTQAATDFVQAASRVAATFERDWQRNVVPSGRSPLEDAAVPGSGSPGVSAPTA